MKNIVCFGEVLWDLLPSGKTAGGAPMNVAYHLNNFGYHTQMISCIGADDLGAELLEFLQKKQLDTQLIQHTSDFPTGTVKVSLDDKGHASYEIVQPVAWDFITLQENALKAVQQSDAFIFGSLALRETNTRNTLFELLEKATLKVLDVNLRPPHYSKALFESLFPKVNIVKMNDEELELIGEWMTNGESLEEKAQQLCQLYNWDTLIITQGGDGAFVIHDGIIFKESGTKIKVKDTIGSGDSFLAAFLSKKLEGAPPPTCLRLACATGAYVATQQGGTPEFTEEESEAFLVSNS